VSDLPPPRSACPFCGATRSLVLGIRYGRIYVVRCSPNQGGCGATGPTTQTTSDAAWEVWNQRKGGARVEI